MASARLAGHCLDVCFGQWAFAPPLRATSDAGDRQVTTVLTVRGFLLLKTLWIAVLMLWIAACSSSPTVVPRGTASPTNTPVPTTPPVVQPTATPVPTTPPVLPPTATPTAIAVATLEATVPPTAAATATPPPPTPAPTATPPPLGTRDNPVPMGDSVEVQFAEDDHWGVRRARHAAERHRCRHGGEYVQ